MAGTDSLFPLPLVAMERYLLADDRAEYPMAFVLGLRLGGTIRRDAMEEAVRTALGRHPLLRATVDDPAARRPCWVPVAAADDPLDWGAADAPLACRGGEAIDLARRPGVRLWVRQGDGRATLTGQFHHACCDGLGAMAFLGDVMAQYGLRTARGPDRPEPADFDPRRLLARGNLGRARPGFFGGVGTLAGTLAHAARFAACRPAPLRAAQPAPIDPARQEPFPGLHGHTLDVADSQRLVEAARRAEATVNDLLLARLFQTIAEWNDPAPHERGTYRVLMPASLRGDGDAAMPAANVVALSFLARSIRDCRGDPLPSVRAETARVKRTRRGLYFVRAIELAQAVCGRMPAALVAPRCYATVVLSNLGDVARVLLARFPDESGRLRAGDLLVEGILGAPPLRPATRASLFVTRYAGRLGLALRCDPRHFLAADVEALLARLVARRTAD